MSSWWYCESMNAYYNLNNFSQIHFTDDQFELNFHDSNLKHVFSISYNNEKSYNESKNKIIKLLGYS